MYFARNIVFNVFLFSSIPVLFKIFAIQSFFAKLLSWPDHVACIVVIAVIAVYDDCRRQKFYE